MKIYDNRYSVTQFGFMEYWNVGVMAEDRWLFSILHYSSIETLNGCEETCCQDRLFRGSV